MRSRLLSFLLVAPVIGCGSAAPLAHPTPIPSALAAPVASASPATGICSQLPAPSSSDTIAKVEVRGNVRTPLLDICAALNTKAGHPIDEEVLRRDVRELWESGFMDDVVVGSEVSASGRTVTFSVRERPLVRAFSIHGVSALAPTVVEELLGHPHDLFDPTTLRDNIGRVRDAYSSVGYRVADIQFRVENAPKNEVDVIVDVHEGARAIIGSIRLQGVEKAKEQELLALIDTEGGHYNAPGAPYRAETFERAVLLMNAYYWDRGMMEARVNPREMSVSSDQSSLSLVVDITEGPIYRVGKTRCVGDLATTEKRCIDLLGMKKGDVFSRSELARGLERVRTLQAESHRGTGILPGTEVDPKKRTVDLKIAIGKE